MKPSLSFIIPAYNADKYLAEAISSCLGQSHKSIEVIVVNDGSTDGTQEIVDFYSKNDPRVTGIKIGHSGIGEARNTGCSKAQADYLAVLDADDQSDKKRAENTLALFKEKGDCLLYSDAAAIDALSGHLGTIKSKKFDMAEAEKSGVNGIVHSTVAYPKWIWASTKYDEGDYSRLGLDDWKFQLDCVKKGIPLEYTEKILSAYRYNERGISKVRNHDEVVAIKRNYFENEIIKA